LKSDGIEQISFLDEEERKAGVAIGQVDNADGRLRAGQMIKAFLYLSPRSAEIVVPTGALVSRPTPRSSSSLKNGSLWCGVVETWPTFELMPSLDRRQNHF
jgi:hypothetical protein